MSRAIRPVFLKWEKGDGMTPEQIKERILASHLYRDCGRFTPGVLEKLFKKEKPKDWKVWQAMRELCRDGKLEKVGPGVWRKSSDAQAWLTRPWRKHSNEELGIDPLLHI